MAICPQVKAIYEETIRKFTFRNSDGITIPKNVRENAYTLAVDIVIVSTSREVYKNYSVSPAEGFYGNATLIMQDMCEIKIPVRMPRQRLYYGRVAEAFQIWQSLVDWSYFQSYMTAIGESLVSLGTALGAGFVPAVNCCSLPDRSWVELPLREVYFNCPSGTQYEIEVSWYKALQITDGCGDIRNPTSKTPDSNKDTGLPPNGVQPNVAPDKNNPFGGLPPASTNEEQDGFNNSKLDGLDNVDPSNIPTTPNDLGVTVFRYSARMYPTQGTVDYGANEIIITPSRRGSTYAISPAQNGTSQPLTVLDTSGLTGYSEFLTQGLEIYNISFTFYPN